MSTKRRNFNMKETDDYNYICECCGHKFDTPATHYEYTEYWGGWAKEEVSGCPVCGGGYYDAKPWERKTDIY